MTDPVPLSLSAKAWDTPTTATPLADLQAARRLVQGVPLTITVDPVRVRAYLADHPESEFARAVVAWLDAHPNDTKGG